MPDVRYLIDARCEHCGRGLGVYVSLEEIRQKNAIGSRDVVQWQRCRDCRRTTPIRAGAYHRAALRRDLNGR